MSELKATTAQEIVRIEKDCDYMDELFCDVKMPPTQVYLKSEADKVIAELKSDIADLRDDKKLTDAILDERNAEIVELKKACNDKDDWCLHTLKENRHQKYKRCLAMAMMLEHICPITIRKAEWKGKWHLRWLELAEKFKEAE